MLVTEFMENGDLFRGISADSIGRFGWYRQAGLNGRLTPNTGLARRIALDVARGLFFLHDKKVGHQDVGLCVAYPQIHRDHSQSPSSGLEPCTVPDA